MQYRRSTIGMLFITVVLAGCAPKPTPIMPEPIYDKYGAIVDTGQGCRPAGHAINDTFPADMPECGCAGGQQSTVAQDQCVPITRDGGRNPQTPRNPNGIAG